MKSLGRALLLGLGKLWLLSLRVRWPEGAEIPPRAVLVLWHEHLPACMRAFAHRGIGVLISRSGDGHWAAEACRAWGYRVFRGSSTRGVLSGMKALARALSRGGQAGMALDGPRGPRGLAKSGSLWLAACSGLPLVPIAVRARLFFRLGTWDRTVVPLPFSRVDIRLGRPLFPRDLAEIDEAMGANQELLSSLS